MDTPTLLTPDNRIVPTRFSRKLKKCFGYYNTVKDEIVIDANLTGEKRLEIYIHEALHAIEPKWDEHAVDGAAKSLADYIMQIMEFHQDD